MKKIIKKEQQNVTSLFLGDIFNGKENALHSIEELWDWIDNRKKLINVSLTRVSLDECNPWYYNKNEGCIRNESGSFFKIFGLRQYREGNCVCEQPIIEQNEIGFLGIITSKINGVWHYLMQAKIEPGNIGIVQLSPTLQATKSNFTCVHGGNPPMYLDYFLKMRSEDIIVDQIQSEQSSRFLKKRNRNVILEIKETIKEPDSHRWMTLRQIKEMMKYENLVNMDTRTVLSCIPYVLLGQDGDVPFKDKEYFYKTAWSMNRKTLVSIYKEINDYKMLGMPVVKKVPLFSLDKWMLYGGYEFSHKDTFPFKIIFCNIYIRVFNYC